MKLKMFFYQSSALVYQMSLLPLPIMKVAKGRKWNRLIAIWHQKQQLKSLHCTKTHSFVTWKKKKEQKRRRMEKDCACKIVDVVKWTFFQITHFVRRKRKNKNIKTLFAILLMLYSFSHSTESRKNIVQLKEEEDGKKPFAKWPLICKWLLCKVLQMQRNENPFWKSNPYHESFYFGFLYFFFRNIFRFGLPAFHLLQCQPFASMEEKNRSRKE